MQYDTAFEYLDLNTTTNLMWNPSTAGSLLTALGADSVATFDINMKSIERQLDVHQKFLDPQMQSVEHVAWHELFPTILGACTRTGHFFLWDVRSKDTSKASHCVHAHTKPVNSMAFNPFSPYVLATASSDGTVAQWDLRNLKVSSINSGSVYSFENCFHSKLKINSLTNKRDDECHQLKWCPQRQTVLGVTTQDRRVYLYDLDRTLDEQTQDEADDGPPTLMFNHSGHTSKVFDLDWNPSDPLVIASVSDDNVLQVWQVVGGQRKKVSLNRFNFSPFLVAESKLFVQ